MNGSVLVPAALLAILIVPAQAQARGNSAFGVTTHRSGGGQHHALSAGGGSGGNFGCNFGGGGHHDRGGGGHHGGGGHDVRAGAQFGCGGYADNWGYYDPQINRSWDSDSYNDWWHDRPDRAYPRWVQQNAGCTPDRMWWSGNGWHC